VYSFNGELIKTYKFEKKMYRELIPGNYNLQKIRQCKIFCVKL